MKATHCSPNVVTLATLVACSEKGTWVTKRQQRNIDENYYNQLLPILPCSKTTAAAVTAKWQLRNKMFKTVMINWLVGCCLDKATGKENAQIISWLLVNGRSTRLAIFDGYLLWCSGSSMFAVTVLPLCDSHLPVYCSPLINFSPSHQLSNYCNRLPQLLLPMLMQVTQVDVFSFWALLQMLLSQMSFSCRAKYHAATHANAVRHHHCKSRLVPYRLFLFKGTQKELNK